VAVKLPSLFPVELEDDAIRLKGAGLSFESIVYTGSAGTGAKVDRHPYLGTLAVDSGVPFFTGEKIIILVQ
jgi:hypothetical protein